MVLRKRDPIFYVEPAMREKEPGAGWSLMFVIDGRDGGVSEPSEDEAHLHVCADAMNVMAGALTEEEDVEITVRERART